MMMDHTAAKTSLLVLCAIRDAQTWSSNMLKDIDFAIEANRAVLASAPSAPAELGGEDFAPARGADTAAELLALTAVAPSADTAARVIEAARALANEVYGCWGMREPSLRSELGNTNYSIVRDRLIDFDVALAAHDGTRG